VTRIVIVRHGETDWNRDRRVQGHSDTPLNDSGRAQARALAAELGDVDVVYASDLSRARETAGILAGGREVRVDPRLRERSFGDWEGLTTTEIEERYPDGHRRWQAGEGFGDGTAEPYEAVRDRVASFLEDVLRDHPDETVLVVTHGGSARVVYALASGLDYVRDHGSIPPLDNCAVVRYAVRGGKLAPVD
jgi:broad specificity phosphatase PhoE